MKFVLASHNQGKLAEMQRILGRAGGGGSAPVRIGAGAGAGGNRHHLHGERPHQGRGRHAGQRPARHCRRLRPVRGRPERRPRCVLRPLWRLGRRCGPLSAAAGESPGAGTRAAHFHTSVVCCFPNGDVLEAEGDCHGTIAYAPQGENGFGYDPVFFVPEMRKTFGQLTPEEKNAISHRGVALRAFGEKLKEYMENH